ncbi:hypothetical protein ACO2JC_15955, partial [Leptospira kirschneri]|uniref:hypothetical protein n=1 Tax=Leptospira kirschneri TaxID=29507 RepID=UPI00368E0229
KPEIFLRLFYCSHPGLRALPSLCTSPNLAFEATLSLLGAAVGREAIYYESLEDSGTLLMATMPGRGLKTEDCVLDPNFLFSNE